MPFCSIHSAIEDIRAGRMVIVVDDEDRENEGDFTLAAEQVTPEAINFMVTHGRGLVCLALTPERLETLQVPLMVSENTSAFGTAFTVSIEARRGVTTGISAADRCRTILTAVDPATRPTDLARPGHIFPLRARPGGVLERAGQTEASVDLSRLAGLAPAGVICEVMNEDGTMARLPQLEKIAARFGLKIVSIADLIHYRLRTEKLVQEVTRGEIATEFGPFTAVVFRNTVDDCQHLALVRGDIGGQEPVHVRVQTQTIPGDLFHALSFPSGDHLRQNLRFIAQRDRGVFVYLMPPHGCLSLADEIRRFSGAALPGTETNPEPDPCGKDPLNYGIGAQILASLGLGRIIVLSRHVMRFRALQGYGLEVTGFEDAGEPEGEEYDVYVEARKTCL